MAGPPRVAFFTDSFHEVNGVARTSREFHKFAAARDYPFLSIHPGTRTRRWQEGAVTTFELRNSRLSIALETDLRFDPLFLRHWFRLLRATRHFAPDIVHVTGPGHCGLLGAILAHYLRVPLVASWHTNVHEFGARRLRKLIRYLPWLLTDSVCQGAEQRSLDVLLWFYRMARVQFAPNPELVGMLASRTKRPCYLMRRGIDTELFSPERRTRPSDEKGEFVIGYVGRLSPEKDVRQLVELERKLIAAGLTNYRFLVVGDGGDRPFLAAEMERCDLPGVLLGNDLSNAYANMDAFVFPSETDTFGNVVLEALASGLPAIVSSGGGPQYIIDDGVNGFKAATVEDYAGAISRLYRDRELLRTMKAAAREKAFTFSWTAVFDNVYSHYPEALSSTAAVLPRPAPASL